MLEQREDFPEADCVCSKCACFSLLHQSIGLWLDYFFFLLIPWKGEWACVYFPDSWILNYLGWHSLWDSINYWGFQYFKICTTLGWVILLINPRRNSHLWLRIRTLISIMFYLWQKCSTLTYLAETTHSGKVWRPRGTCKLLKWSAEGIVLSIVTVGVDTVRLSCGASGTWDTSAAKMEFQSWERKIIANTQMNRKLKCQP